MFLFRQEATRSNADYLFLVSQLLTCRRIKSIFDAEIVRPSRQSQEDVINLHDSHRLTNDSVIDVEADAVAAPTSSGKSVIYTPGQQFLLAPGLDYDKPRASIQSVQSVGSTAHLLKNPQSQGFDGIEAVDKGQDEYLLAAAPTTENLAQLQEHHRSAAEECQAHDLIRAHPASSPRSAFWGEESRLVSGAPVCMTCPAGSICSCMASTKAGVCSHSKIAGS